MRQVARVASRIAHQSVPSSRRWASAAAANPPPESTQDASPTFAQEGPAPAAPSRKATRSAQRELVSQLFGYLRQTAEVRHYLKHFGTADTERFAVVKVTGDLLHLPGEADRVASALAFLHQMGLVPVVIHGAGLFSGRRAQEVADALRHDGHFSPIEYSGSGLEASSGMSSSGEGATPDQAAASDARRLRRRAARHSMRAARKYMARANTALCRALAALGVDTVPMITSAFNATVDKSITGPGEGVVANITAVNTEAILAAVDAGALPVIAALAPRPPPPARRKLAETAAAVTAGDDEEGDEHDDAVHDDDDDDDEEEEEEEDEEADEAEIAAATALAARQPALTFSTWKAAASLARELRPLKVIVLRPEGGFLKGDGSRLGRISLARDLQRLCPEAIPLTPTELAAAAAAALAEQSRAQAQQGQGADDEEEDGPALVPGEGILADLTMSPALPELDLGEAGDLPHYPATQADALVDPEEMIHGEDDAAPLMGVAAADLLETESPLLAQIAAAGEQAEADYAAVGPAGDDDAYLAPDRRSSQLSAGDHGVLRHVAGLFDDGELEPGATVAITSPQFLAAELFTERGSGTLVVRGEKIRKFTSFQQVDKADLKDLLEQAFGKRLPDGYFDDRAQRLRSIYASESMRGAAIVTTEDGIAYLDKFAVSPSAQGDKLGDDVWQALVEGEPKLFWRSRSDNRVNGWYFSRAHGSYTAPSIEDPRKAAEAADAYGHAPGYWTVFWRGLGDSDILDAVRAAHAMAPTFT
ncbi:hypothetical protein FNF31_07601 [Cafeteria roenbergensis]|uniref:N-acetyltransferase domain-containing protein n=1 Tax=Cafeteria roenbergensis TaxID=33653 RepID=A0A5A8C4D2_CAFRO|nr:hypothetical protein FNF31_07601 [Cafeteria roenbergensis]KAA0160917.1 hypothetical protein FNF28_05264 [Cafeteria roenbergensis]